MDMKLVKDAVGALSGASSLVKAVDDSKKENYQVSSSSTAFNVLGQLIGLYCAYLSWICNQGESTAMRVLYALVAWFFGLLYLAYFFLYKKGTCADGSKPELNPYAHYKATASSSASASPSAYLRF